MRKITNESPTRNGLPRNNAVLDEVCLVQRAFVLSILAVIASEKSKELQRGFDVVLLTMFNELCKHVNGFLLLL